MVGVVASYFAIASDYTLHFFETHIQKWVLLPLIVSPITFGISAWMTSRFFPGAAGSGIPQAIAARIVRDPKSRRFLLGPQLMIGKMLLTLLALLGGASIGREGPTVQVGAAIMLMCGSIGGLSAERGIVLAGSAAGVAAAFNTPLAGIVFAIEEMARAFEHRNSSIVLIAIVLSGAASMSILGDYNYFGYIDAQLTIGRDWLSIAVIGLAGGLLGSIFSRLVLDGGDYLRGMYNNIGTRNPLLFGAACGLVIAALGIATHGLTYGTGYHMARSLLHSNLAGTWWQTPAKLMATAICAISGTPGGIFSPSLSVGAAMGGEFAYWLTVTPQQGIILLSMVAYFAGVTQAPITAFVIVLEITGNASSAVPLIATAVIAAGVGRLLCPVSLYHALAKGYISRVKSESLPAH